MACNIQHLQLNVERHNGLALTYTLYKEEIKYILERDRK